MSKADICVIGAGTFGASVIQQLNKLEKSVLVIERDEQQLSLLDSTYNSLILAEAADLRAIKACGIESFDTVIVGVSDNIEIVAALLELNIDTIIARAKTRRHARVLRQIGVDVIIQPEAEAGTRTALIATNPNFVRYSTKLNEIGDGFVLGAAAVTNPKFLDKQLKTLALNKMGITIVIVKRKKKETILPSATLELAHGDIITVVGKLNRVTRFFDMVNQDMDAETDPFGLRTKRKTKRKNLKKFFTKTETF